MTLFSVTVMNDPAAGPAHSDVGEQPGGIELLHTLVDGFLISAGEIRLDGFAIDAFVALDNHSFGQSRHSAAGEPHEGDNCNCDPVLKATLSLAS